MACASGSTSRDKNQADIVQGNRYSVAVFNQMPAPLIFVVTMPALPALKSESVNLRPPIFFVFYDGSLYPNRNMVQPIIIFGGESIGIKAIPHYFQQPFCGIPEMVYLMRFWCYAETVVVKPRRRMQVVIHLLNNSSYFFLATFPFCTNGDQSNCVLAFPYRQPAVSQPLNVSYKYARAGNRKTLFQ